MMKRYYALLALLFLLNGCQQPEGLLAKLQALPNVQAQTYEPIDGFKQGYLLWVKQPLDHNNPASGYFHQRVYVFTAELNDGSAPTVLQTEGYSLYQPFQSSNPSSFAGRFRQKELAHILNGNLVAVEYRFFGDSKNTGEIPWSHLTVEQAAADHHRIVTLLKPFFKGPWVNSGYSKGGESALFHRRFYPDDVVATVTYDAPLILGEEDRRTDAFIKRKNAAAGACGQELIRFQRELLQRRNELIPALKAHAEKENMQFSIGLDVALEYAALEYTFSFWQRGQACEDIPAAGAPPQDMLAHIEEGGGFWVYSDTGIKELEPSFYQHHRQLGYYGFITDDLQDLLQAVPQPTNRDFLPQDVEVEFDAEFIPSIIGWLQKYGNNIIYLYGENDTWYACAVDHSTETNAFTLVQQDGYHNTHIKDLAPAQKAKLYEALERWLNVPLKRI